MARVVSSYVRSTKKILAYTVDDDVLRAGQTHFLDAPLYPLNSIFEKVAPSECVVIVAMGYRDMNALRLARIQWFRELGYKVTGYCHPTLLKHDDVNIDDTAIILDQVSIHTGSTIGAHAFVTSNVNIGHDCNIGEGVWINGGVSIGGGSTIGASSVLSINAAISHGIKLGDRVFVGANTLVSRSVDDDLVLLSEEGQLHRLRSKSFLKFAGLQG